VAVLSVIKEYFHVGDRAPESGTYRAIHRGHRKTHIVVAIRGDEFPQCRFCKNDPVFVLLERVDYIAHDLDFAGLPLEKPQPLAKAKRVL
jgi:hypothetical protein